jgi:hypothetical protein
MATMNISLPDELKARMDDDPRQSSWSAVARKAFELELRSAMKLEDNDMTATVERLRASKEKIEQEQRPIWLGMGREWAMKHAEFDELERVTALAESEGWMSTDDAHEQICTLYEAVHDEAAHDIRDVERFALKMFERERTPSSSQLDWFVEGAAEIGDEVLDRV